MQDFLKLNNSIYDKWVLLVLFLFPIAGPVIRHWNNFFFLLITVTALIFVIRKVKRKILFREEKVFLWVFVSFFFVFILSALLNGWGNAQTLELGNELKFLFFVPIYLLVREVKLSRNALLCGVMFSLPVIFIFSVYEYYWVLPTVGRQELYGAYFHLFIGPITALMLLMIYPAYKVLFTTNKYMWLFPIYGFMGMFVILFSHARLAYLTILGGSFLLIFLIIKNIKARLVSGGLIALIVLIVFQINSVQQRFLKGVGEVKNYISQYKDIDSEIHSTSFGLRLEMWRSAQYVIKDKPLLGIGGGNYSNYIKKYTSKGLVSKAVEQANQVHNSFVEVIISKGIIGFLLLLMIFYYPVYLSWKNKAESEKAYLNFVVISVFTAGVSLMSLGESMLINKDNGVSYLIFFNAVLFSTLISEIKKDDR